MIREFVKEGSIYALAGIAAKGLSLLMIPIFTYYFSTRDFGRIEILYVVSMLTSSLLSWQLGQGLIRYVSQHQSNDKRRTYMGSTAFIFTISSYFLGVGVLIILGKQILDFLGLSNEINTKTYTLCLVAILLNGIFTFFGSHLQALRKKNEFAITNFIHSLLGILATYMFVIVLDKSINGIFYATIITVPITIGYQFWILRKEYKWWFSTSILRQLLEYSVPLIPGSLALILLSITDRVMLNYLTTTSTLGIYSVALKFALGFQIIVQGFGMAINPLTFEKYLEPGTSKSISILLSQYIKIGALLILVMSLFSKEIIQIFTQVPYYNAQFVLPMLFTSVWIQGITMFTLGLQISKKTYQISIIVCVSVFINIVLNYYLIPIFDIKGAAFSTLISALVNTVLLVHYSKKSFSLSITIFDVILFISVLVLIILFSTSTIGGIFAFFTVFYKLIIAAALVSILIFSISKLRNLAE